MVVAPAVGCPGLLSRFTDELNGASTTRELMVVEAEAANLYWKLWNELRLGFNPQARSRVPDHWTTAGPRSSPQTTQRAKHAVTPIQALLNYGYALAEADTFIACHTLGLDPYLGVLHADRANRPSLVYDMLEPTRPLVDGDVLTVITDEEFDRRDFIETRTGTCRLNRRLTHQLAEPSAGWHQPIHSTAERVARALADTRHEHVVTPPSVESHRAKDIGHYRGAILPGLKSVPIRQIADATGLTTGYCPKIRAGQHVPHRRHWPALSELGGEPA